MKFEDAYCTYENRIITIDGATRIFGKNAETFANFYRDGFWCPECRAARLVYHNAATPYFSTYPRAAHDADCSMRQDVMDKKQVESFVEATENKEQLIRQIKSIMQILLFETATAKDTYQYRPTHSIKETSSAQTCGLTETHGKQVPRKRIDTNFREEDFMCFKFFYGDVFAAWEKDDEYNKYRLILRGIHDHKFICRIGVSYKVYAHLPKEIKIKEPFNCKIVFLASMEKKKNYMKCSLRWSDYLHIYRI